MSVAPVILVPGLGGSILVNKRAVYKRHFNKRIIDNKWISSTMIHPHYHHKWSREIGISLRKNLLSDKILGYMNTDIVPYDFGGVLGVQNVAPELVSSGNAPAVWDQFFNHRYFGPLIYGLQEAGIPVYAAPYDFRTILDPLVREAYFLDLERLIQKVSEKHDAPSLLVGHSQGAIITKWFTHERGDLGGRVKGQVLVNCPFGGAPQAIRTVFKGAFYLPIFEGVYRKHLEINSGIIMGLPNNNAYGLHDLFWRDSQKDVRLEDIDKKEHYSVGFKVFNDLFREHTWKISAESQIATYLYTSMGVPTPMMYLDDECMFTDGDGMIPAKSLMAFKWAQGIVRVRDMDHTEILRDPNLVRFLEKLSKY